MSQQAKQTIPQGQPQDVIGGGIDAGVIAQILEREKLISVKRKSNEHLLFFNGNGSWARVVSSVNTITEEEAIDLATNKKPVDEVVGNNTLAYNNVLMGGTLKQSTAEKPTKYKGGISETEHSPIKLSENGYVESREPSEDSKVHKSNSYHKYKSLGFRPTPGIESVNVKSKGTYGTLREAEVNFKVWTLEDLEIANKLYLRPGYTVLLEWGHSIGLSSEEDKGALIKQIDTYKKFLADNLTDPMKKFEEELKKKRRDSGFNYDAMVGYVSNFNWSLNEQGGYDCSIKIISKGSVLESIAVTFDPTQTMPADQMRPRKESKGKKERKSIYHKFFVELEACTGLNSAEVDGVLDYLNPLNSTFPDFKFNNSTSENFDAFKTWFFQQIEEDKQFLSDLPTALKDLAFGNKEQALSIADTVDSFEGTLAMQNDAFEARVNKIKFGDDVELDHGDFDDTIKFGSTSEDSLFTPLSVSSFAGLEPSQVTTYINRYFKKYKLEAGILREKSIAAFDVAIIAEQAAYIYIKKEEDPVPSINDVNAPGVFPIDYGNSEGNRVTTLQIYDFITENARLPESELTPEQKAQRERLTELKKKYDEFSKQNQQIINENDAVQTGLEPEGSVDNTVFTKANFSETTQQHLKKSLNDFIAFRLKDLEKKDTGAVDNENLNEFWIPLYTVLDIYNNYISLVDATKAPSKGTNTTGRKLTQFYTGFQDENVNTLVYEKKLKYLTTPQHFSINPMVCILPKTPINTVLKKTDGSKIEWPDGQGTSYPVGVIWKNGFHSNVQNAFATGKMRGEQDDILNILISCDWLQTELSRILKEDEDTDRNEGNNMVSFMRTLLKAMNEAMGSVNELDLFYDEVDDLFYIVDRKVTPALRNLIPTLSLSGLKSTMTNVSIDSQISNQIGNMVAIAAQGTGGNTKKNVQTLLKWNSGLLDRHIRHKSENKTDENEDVKKKQAEVREKPEDIRLEKWVADYYDFWQEFNGENWFDKGDFNAGILDALGNYHKKYSQKYVVELYHKGDASNPLPPPGVIPVELSFETMGIGGLKIGQAFQIEQGLLPILYSKDFGYIITGLEHDITQGKWISKVKTQFYSVKPPTKAELEYFSKYLTATSEGYSPPQSTSSPTEGGTPGPVILPSGTIEVPAGVDPAPIINPNKVGRRRYPNSPQANVPSIKRIASGGDSALIRTYGKSDIKRLAQQGVFAPIGGPGTPGADWSSTLSSNVDGTYYLAPKAASQFKLWYNAMVAAGIKFKVSSALRFGEDVGAGPHGYGGAVDFANLHRLVGGNEKTPANLKARIENPVYAQMAGIGAQFGWYNPWRLSDNSGQEEIWHFEYWGPVTGDVAYYDPTVGGVVNTTTTSEQDSAQSPEEKHNLDIFDKLFIEYRKVFKLKDNYGSGGEPLFKPAKGTFNDNEEKAFQLLQSWENDVNSTARKLLIQVKGDAQLEFIKWVNTELYSKMAGSSASDTAKFRYGGKTYRIDTDF